MEEPIINETDSFYKRLTILENKWIWDMYKQFEALLINGITPLETYLTMYEQFKDILSINIEEYCKAMDNEEEPKEISEIVQEIEKV